jgi:hypothetical protein
MASAKPVLALNVDGDMKTLLAKSGAGFFSDSSDPNAIGDLLIELFERWEKGGLVLEPDWEFIRGFERKTLTEKLSSLFNEVAN